VLPGDLILDPDLCRRNVFLIALRIDPGLNTLGRRVRLFTCQIECLRVLREVDVGVQRLEDAEGVTVVLRDAWIRRVLYESRPGIDSGPIREHHEMGASALFGGRDPSRTPASVSRRCVGRHAHAAKRHRIAVFQHLIRLSVVTGGK
jgi:hypothetical protein